MKILYTIGTLTAIAVIALGVASFGGDTSVSEIFTQPEVSQQQEGYVDNTGDIVGGLPEATEIQDKITEAEAKEPVGNPESIKLISPKGGEVLVLDGTPIRITWEPYEATIFGSANNLDLVTLNLERKVENGFQVVGRMVNGGSESLGAWFHWLGNLDDFLGNIPPEGEYYIHVQNMVTGAEDRTDAPVIVKQGLPIVEVEIIPFEILENNITESLTANYRKTVRVACKSALSSRFERISYDLYKDGVFFVALVQNLPAGNINVFAGCSSYDWTPEIVLEPEDASIGNVFTVRAIIYLKDGTSVGKTSRTFGFYGI